MKNKFKETTLLHKLNYIFLFFVMLFFFVFSYITIKYRLLNFKRLNIIVISVFFLLILCISIIILKKKIQKISLFLLMLLSLLLGFILYQYNLSIGFLNEITNITGKSKFKISIIALKNNQYELDDVIDDIVAPVRKDSKNVNYILNKLKEDKNLDISFKNVNSYFDAYDKLSKNEVKAIVLSSKYYELINGNSKDLDSKIEVLYEVEVIEESGKRSIKKKNIEKPNSENEILNIYISGIDSFGDIDTISRSDVNILMTVNKTKGKILLTSTPRDTYLKIPGDGYDEYDKLTHAGIYGVETSMGALENLYEIGIDYYIRINFTSFVELIDLLGGIEVYNSEEFTSGYGNYYFPEGNIHLSSETALGFVRERYSLSDGDLDRGRNHEKVITAIIYKLQSKDVLLNYTNILDKMSDLIQTNFSTDELIDLVNEQLDKGTDYDVKSQDLKGFGRMDLPSFAMPGYELYMMQVDEESLEKVKLNIEEVMK